MFKVNNKNTRTTSTINFEYMSRLFNVLSDFEQVNVSWVEDNLNSESYLINQLK